ncbi:hypothetical protein ACQKKJ_15470, partial [Staphylococcus cohnii]
MEKPQNLVKTSEARKKVVVTSMGNAIEWFDFALYAQLATYISHNFFGDVASQNQLLFSSNVSSRLMRSRTERVSLSSL